MVYSCLSKLSKHPRFYDKLVYARGISILAGETRSRRKKLRKMSRRERTERDDEIKAQGIEIFEAILQYDIASISIQCLVRKFLTSCQIKKQHHPQSSLHEFDNVYFD